MHLFFELGFWSAWIFLMAYWLLKARANKTTARSSSNLRRWLQSALIFLGFCLITNVVQLGPLSRPLLPPSPLLTGCGLALTWAGVLFAIWARSTLGRNWSAKPTVKQDHELITAGPYRLARHPIYTGMLLGAVGTALASTEWRGLIGVLMITVAFLLKIQIEERLMLETFPDSYPAYRREVKALLPGLL